MLSLAVLAGVVVVIMVLEVVVGLYIDLKLTDSNSALNKFLDNKELNERKKHASIPRNSGRSPALNPDYRSPRLDLRKMGLPEVNQSIQADPT